MITEGQVTEAPHYICVTPQTQKGPKYERRTIKSENVRDFIFFSTHDKDK